MSGNTIGTLFAVTSFGESHGPAIGCVVDGCPPGMELCAADIQAEPHAAAMRVGISSTVVRSSDAAVFAIALVSLACLRA